MGMLGSKIEKIAQIHFRPFPRKRAFSPAKIFNTNRGVYATVKNAPDTVYTTGELAGKVCLCGTGTDYPAVQALLAFGIITKKEAYVHGEQKRASDKAFAQYRAVTLEVEKLRDVGIKLTPKQLATIHAMRKNLPVQDLPFFVRGEAARKLGLKE